MKLHWAPDDGRGHAALQCAPDPASEQPVLDRLLLDVAPMTVSNDRVAVAGVLAFRPWVSGELELPAGVSRPVVEAVQAYCGTPAVTSWPVSVNEVSHYTQGRVLTVAADGASRASPPWPGKGESLLHLRRSDRFAGSLLAFDEIVLGTNAFVLGTVGEQGPGLAATTLSTAVLFTEDFGASTIELRGEELTVPDAALVDRLLSSVELTLVAG